jgi:methylated-DNA-[protein]-cysteine S-methyltransferase
MTVTPELDARFRAAALADGLVDVRFDTFDSPLGPLHVAATERGLCRISYFGEAWEEQLAHVFGVRVLRSPLDEVRRELDEYFEGRRQEFDLSLDWSLTHGFFRKVLRHTAQIGYGSVGTYAEMARKAGSPRAVRAAGNALGANPIPIVVPCHRVLRTGGALGGYGGGVERKEFLLRHEGVIAA